MTDDLTKLTYPCLMYCLCHELENEFSSYFEKTKIPGWVILHDKVVRVELAMWQAKIDTEFPHKEEFMEEMKYCMSLAKELLGHHGHINFLWRLQQMVKNWHLQTTITFDEICKVK